VRKNDDLIPSSPTITTTGGVSGRHNGALIKEHGAHESKRGSGSCCEKGIRKGAASSATKSHRK